MKKKTAIIILSVLLAAVIAMLIYDMVINKTFDTNTLMRAGIIIAGFVLSLVRIIAGSQRSTNNQRKVYQEQYKDIIRTAFSRPEEKKQLDRLLRRIDFFNKEDSIAKALKELNELIPYCNRPDDYCAVYSFIALSHEELWAYYPAIDAYKKALEYDETRSSIWSNLGRLYKNIGKNQDAAESLEKAIYYDGENSFAYHNLASVCYSEGDYDKTIEYDKIALEKNSKLYQAAALLCLVYHQLGNKEESDRYFRIAVANGQDASALRKAKDNVK